MFTLTWLKDAAERVVSTFAATLLSVLGGDGLDLFHLDWGKALGIAGGAALISLLKAVAVGQLPIGTPGTATPVDITKTAETVNPPTA